MGGDAGSMLQQGLGYAVGGLSALTSLKSGGLQNYFINRQRLLEDPAFRATLIGSPFTSGVFFQSGSMQPPAAAPGAAPPATAAAQPPDMLFGAPTPGGVGATPPAPSAGTVASPSDVAWLQQQTPDRRFLPNLPPLAAQTQVEVQAAQGIVSGLQSADPVVRAQAKLAGKIPLTPEETIQATRGAMSLQAGLGPGSTVGLQIPGMPIQIGSPYNLSAVTSEEYPSYDVAAAAAAARNAGLPAGTGQWRPMPSGRGTWLLAPPPTHEQGLPVTPPPPVTTGAMPGAPQAPVMRGGTPPTPAVPMAPGATAGPPLFAGAVTTTGGAPPTLPTRSNNPGSIKDGPFARSQPGYVGPGQAMGDGGHMAVFDSPASGFNAMSNLLDKPRYQGQTVGGAVGTWTAGGHDAEFVRREIGLDPMRPMDSLSPAEKAQLVRGIAHGEGYQGPLGSGPPPATRPTPVIAPPPAPHPAPPAPVAPAPAFDPNATVPHVIIPAPATAEAAVGYPSAAPEPAPGAIAPTTIPVLRSPGAPAAAIPGAPPPARDLPGIPVDPQTGLPLAGRTYESQTGSATYTAPPRGDPKTQMILRYNGITDPALADPAKIVDYFATEQALKNNESMDKAAIERIQRGMTEGESTEFRRLLEMKTAYNNFIKQYPEAADRAKFLGFVDAPLQTLRERLGWQDAQAIRDFRNSFAPFALESLTDEKGKAQSGMEGIAQMAPSVSDSAGAFESNLQHFGDALDRRLTIVSNLRGLPVGAASPALVDSWVDQLQHQSLTNRLGAFQPPPAATAPTLAPPPAAAAGPPPPAASLPWQPTWVR